VEGGVGGEGVCHHREGVEDTFFVAKAERGREGGREGGWEWRVG